MQSATIRETASSSLRTAILRTTPPEGCMATWALARTCDPVTKAPDMCSMCGLAPFMLSGLSFPVPSHGCIPKKETMASMASSIFLNWRANFSRTSLPLPIASQALRKSGTVTLAMKSEVEISKSSSGYSSSKVPPSSSPVAGSTSTTVNRSSQVKLLEFSAAAPFCSRRVKQFLVSPYEIPSVAISPEAEKTSDSLSSTRTVTLSSRCSSMVFWTLNCRTTWFWNMCLTHCTTYSVSDSVSITGVDDRKARPNDASSGIAYTTEAGSTISFFLTG
mmetsp:Transcript_26568/g.73055  ORF Transcript_26568/g.73055 Transcript_26568/m.73055 type:complete len:276 (+) Transcript_26568:574-1401(+)